MEEIKLAYMAGLIDGEGTITLTKRRKSDLFRTPTVSLTSTTKQLVEVCQNTFGGWIATKKLYAKHHKQAWSWYCNGDAAVSVCTVLLPYCLEPDKARRMRLISDRYKLITVRNGKYTPHQLIVKEQFETDFFHPSNSISEDLGVL